MAKRTTKPPEAATEEPAPMFPTNTAGSETPVEEGEQKPPFPDMQNLNANTAESLGDGEIVDDIPAGDAPDAFTNMDTLDREKIPDRFEDVLDGAGDDDWDSEDDDDGEGRPIRCICIRKHFDGNSVMVPKGKIGYFSIVPEHYQRA